MKTIVDNFIQLEKQAGEVAKSAWEKEFEKGIEKGIEKEKTVNAIKMLKLGIEIKLIQEITGLSLEKIKELKESII